jgi:predicted SAM-dependent methyltransferase
MGLRHTIDQKAWIVRSPPYRLMRWMYHLAHDAVRKSDWYTQRAIREYLDRHQVRKLHVGCADNILDGWLNTEYEFRAPLSVVYLDASKRFPMPSDSFDFAFSEHMIEHVPLEAAFTMLQECNRVLKPGGRVRISTPPLEYLVKLLVSPVKEDEDYLIFHRQEWSPETPVFTPAVAVADYYRQWGHQFVYDEPTLRALMTKAGFVSIEKLALNESSAPELRNLEHDQRLPAGMLKLLTFTLEGVKPL